MNIYTCTTFTGFWPVGTAAIVAAETPEIAAEELNKALKDHGLVGDAEPKDMKPFNPSSSGSVLILRDGNY